MIPNFFLTLMRVKFFIFVSLLFIVFSSTVNANFSGVDTKSKSDASVCSWFSLASVDQVWINEAKRRKLTCGGDKRLIPRNSYASGESWRCKSNYIQKGLSCVKKTPTVKVPSNAHKSGNSWVCNTDYYKAGSICRRVPLNAYSKYNSNYWYCNDGYVKKGGKCQTKITVPSNAHIDGDSWTCNTDYYKIGSMCRRVPANAYSRYYSNEFYCNVGFERKGSGCIKIVKKSKIPVNAHADGTGWVCNTNYYRNKAKNNCLKVPKNAYSRYDSNNWFCNKGYEKKGSSCVLPNIIPNNAHKVGNTWVCNTDYYRNIAKTGCLAVPQNAYSAYSSNFFKCNKGYEKKNSRCVQVFIKINLSKKPDEHICSWFEVANTPQAYIEEAIKRNLNCKAKKENIPNNAHKVGKAWVCNKDYYRNNAKTGCRYVPKNAYSRYDSNNWFCNKGYEKKGSSCVTKIIIPNNAHKVDSSWVCNKNYFRNNAKTGCRYVPKNAYSRYDSNNWFCNKGYEKKGSSCVTKIIIPNNAHKVGNTWVCNKDYYRNNAKTGCLPVPDHSTSAYNSNNFICNSGYERNGNSCKKTYNWSLIIGTLFFLWLIFRKKKIKPAKPDKPSKPTKPRSHTVPTSPPKKTRSRNIKDPRSLLIELGVAIAYVDGQFADEEGYALKRQIQKMIRRSGDSEKHKKLFNDTFVNAHIDGKNNQLSFKDICLNLYTKGDKELRLEALKIAYEIMGSDGHIHNKETEMINYISVTLKISDSLQESIRDNFFVSTVIKKDFDILDLLGLSISASQDEKCKALKKEFNKWNKRTNILKDSTQQKNAEKLLKQIGIAIRKNNC